MTKEFVPYNESLELKELGFDEPCLATHGYLDLYINSNDGHIKAPTYSQAFRWFREKYGIHSYIDCKWKNLGWEYELVDLNKMESISTIGKYGYNKPEEAELACLQQLIQIVKK